jgi:hypothetical protein
MKSVLMVKGGRFASTAGAGSICRGRPYKPARRQHLHRLPATFKPEHSSAWRYFYYDGYMPPRPANGAAGSSRSFAANGDVADRPMR